LPIFAALGFREFRLIWGAQVSLGVGFLTVALQLVVGGGVGLLAGYYGSWLDEVLMRLVDMVLAIPSIFLFILMAILFRPSALTLSLIIASVGWGAVARLVRGEVLSVKNRDFVLATRSVGAGDARLILRHLLPNVLPVMIVTASLGVGAVILVEAALDYLGLGIHPPTPSWGNMLTNAQSYYHHSPYLVVFPGLLIFVTVLATNIFLAKPPMASLLFALAAGRISKQGQLSLIAFFKAVGDALLVIIDWVLWIAPVGVVESQPSSSVLRNVLNFLRAVDEHTPRILRSGVIGARDRGARGQDLEGLEDDGL